MELESGAYLNRYQLEIVKSFGGHPWMYKDWPKKRLIEFFDPQLMHTIDSTQKKEVLPQSA